MWPMPAPPPPPPAPARRSPLRFDVPSPFALARISPVVVSIMRAAIATLAFPFAVPTLPMPYLAPNPPAPTLLLLFSVPNFVTEPTMVLDAEHLADLGQRLGARIGALAL